MRILCERHIAPKYSDALAATTWGTVQRLEGLLPQQADDRVIAEYAKQHGYVVITRDRDFFEICEEVGTGVLYLDMQRNPTPSVLVAAINNPGSVPGPERDS